MFPGSGLGPGWGHLRSETCFYQGYGPATIDPKSIAYYRCERIVQDIAVECQLILSPVAGEDDRRRELGFFASNFEPEGVAEIARQSIPAWR
jgi:spectinomycin phosphotransferase